VYIFLSALNHIMETLKIPGQSIHCIYVFVYIFIVVKIVYTIVILSVIIFGMESSDLRQVDCCLCVIYEN
jgi:hypothetical protein